MTRADKLLERMRHNPRDDFDIDDVMSVCRSAGVSCEAPTRGSHYAIWHDSQVAILTVPARRPVKPVYIRALVAYIQAVKESIGDG
ncbi:MAG: HicA-related toxin-antitoxin protein [Caulobacter sp.]|nr:HicA-related toxin-antitoxin protein [Caulobacter sp.]